MLDMSQTIAVKSDQLNADDLIGKSVTITITKVTGGDSSEQPVNVYYEGDNGKPFKPCKTIRRVMVLAWGKEAAKYAGRSMTLYRDPTVKFGGMEVGGIRVSHMSHIDGKLVLALMASKGKKKAYEVLPLTAEVHQHPAADQADRGVSMTDEYIQSLKDAIDNEELTELRTKGAKFVAKIQKQRPDLYARIIEADPLSAIQPATPSEEPASTSSGEQAAPGQGGEA